MGWLILPDRELRHAAVARQYAPELWVALLTYGEGWHNNHHADPRAAIYGRRWWELDLTYAHVRALEILRLARDVRRPRRVPAG
jgi:fatty-acid desaturase